MSGAAVLELATGFAIVAAKLMGGAWLLHSGLAKQNHWLEWWRALDGYRLLPQTLKRPIARSLPMVEIALGAALWMPWLDRWAALLAAALFAAFAVAIAGNLAAGITRFDCGCHFGRRPPHAGWLLLRALALAVTAAALAVVPDGGWATRVATSIAIALLILIAMAWKNLQRGTLAGSR